MLYDCCPAVVEQTHSMSRDIQVRLSPTVGLLFVPIFMQYKEFNIQQER